MSLMDAIFANAINNVKPQLEKHEVGYVDHAPTVILVPVACYEFTQGEYAAPITQMPNTGDKITLTLDGEVFIETAKEAYIEDFGGYCQYIGNGASLGMIDTGENYFVMFIEMEGDYLAGIAIPAEAETGVTTMHTAGISRNTATAYPWDLRSLPFIELETELSPTVTQVSKADAAKMEAIYRLRRPVVISVTTNSGSQISAYFNYFEYTDSLAGHVVSYAASVRDGIDLYIYKHNNEWEAGLYLH